jgi:hypothetical protein
MHFFCELTNLPTESESFGPLLTGSVYDQKFSISSKFDLSTVANPVRAFACQGGIMIVQQSINPSFVNLIIKPDKNLNINFSPVRYYVYRGISASSFLSGSVIIPKTATEKSEMMTRFWNNWDNNLIIEGKQDTDPSEPNYLAPPTPEAIGYDINLSSSLNVENIYNNLHNPVKAVKVLEGEWIGDFGATTISFEVITDTDILTVDLEYLSKLNHVIDISGMPDSNLEEQFALLVKREEILSYIDPAAFFGMHYKIGVGTSTVDGNGIRSIDHPKKAITEMLENFKNKNRVYLDIRNEHGYSLDFYRNYNTENDNILFKFKLDSEEQQDGFYPYKGWPIFFYDSEDVGNISFKNMVLQLKLADNTNPLLFIENKDIVNNSKKTPNFISDLLASPPDSFTKDIKFILPTKNSGSTLENIAFHVKIQYLRRGNSTSSNVPKFDDFLDNVFADVDLPYLDGAMEIFKKNTSIKYAPVIHNDFVFVTKQTVFKSDNLVSFLTNRIYTFLETEDAYPKISGSIETNAKDVSQAAIFPKNTKFIRVKLESDSDIISVVDIALYNKDKKVTKREELFALFVSTAELNQLKALADTEGLSTKHKRTLVFSNRTQLKDDQNLDYIKYELNVQGLLNDGSLCITEDSGVFVYTLSDRVFCSQDAGNLIDIPFGLPDPGTVTKYQYYGTFDYNDTNIVPAYHPTGFKNIIYDETESKARKRAAIRGICYYPSDAPNGTIASGIFPLIVIIHGNGHLYTDYSSIAKHLAKNGFVVASISLLVQTKREYDLIPVVGTQYKLALSSSILPVQVDLTGVIFDSDTGNLYKQTNSGWQLIKIIGGYSFTALPPKLKFNLGSFIQGANSIGRAELLYEHLKVLKARFGNSLQNNFGILGHSRGGEAVIHAAREILDTNSSIYTGLTDIGLNQLNSVIALAPTDYIAYITVNQREKLDKDVPFFTLYGSRDYDVDGGFATYNELTAFRPNPKEDNSLFMETSFSLYDNAIAGGDKTKFKTSIFVKGATHNGFITKNDPNSVSVIDVATQKKASFSYFNAFFRLTLFNEEYWQPYFTGESIPDSVAINNIQFQFERYTPGIVIDDMQTGGNWSLGSGGGTISLNGSTSQPVSRIVKGSLRRLDSDLHIAIQKEGTSPHLISGIRIYWQANDILVFDVPPSSMDMLSFEYLSFKIANGTRREDLKGMRVGIRDSVDVEVYHALKPILKPDMRKDTVVPPVSYPPPYYNFDPTKNALETIRIPLYQFQSAGVDLATVKKIIFCFPTEKGKTGKVNLSNLIITN